MPKTNLIFISNSHFSQTVRATKKTLGLNNDPSFDNKTSSCEFVLQVNHFVYISEKFVDIFFSFLSCND